MLISAREACRILEQDAGVCRQQARRVLGSGLAGAPTPVGGALLFDSGQVRELAGWRQVDHDALLSVCPGGVFVRRIPVQEGPAALPATQEFRDVGDLARAHVRARLERVGPLPYVVTVCGYPVLVAELRSFVSVGHRRVRAELTGPSETAPWTSMVDHRRLVTSPGPPWLLLGAQPQLGRARRARSLGQSPGACRMTAVDRMYPRRAG